MPSKRAWEEIRDAARLSALGNGLHRIGSASGGNHCGEEHATLRDHVNDKAALTRVGLSSSLAILGGV